MIRITLHGAIQEKRTFAKTCKRDEESTQMIRSLKIRLFEGKCKASTEAVLRVRFFVHNPGMRMVGIQNAFAIFCSFCSSKQNEWNGVLSIPAYECGIKERAHFTF